MKLQDFTGPIDLDLTLRDASLNPDVRPTRRAIAAASIGIEPEDAYYSVRELREACEWIHEGDPAGKAKLAQMLGNRCDDYQRCIYYNLAGRGVCVLIDDLLWLEALLLGRGRVAGYLYRTKAPKRIAPAPYVAAEPDGPVGRFEAEFAIGASWSHDPGPDYDPIDRPAKRDRPA